MNQNIPAHTQHGGSKYSKIVSDVFLHFHEMKKKIVNVSWHSSLAVHTFHQFEDIFFEDLSFSNISVSLHVLRLHFSWPYYFFIRRMKTLRGLPFLWGDEYAKQIIKNVRKQKNLCLLVAKNVRWFISYWLRSHWGSYCYWFSEEDHQGKSEIILLLIRPPCVVQTCKKLTCHRLTPILREYSFAEDYTWFCNLVL